LTINEAVTKRQRVIGLRVELIKVKEAVLHRRFKATGTVIYSTQDAR
jgi:hypothetical protein